jgi:rhamnogalacturonan endolyase
MHTGISLAALLALSQGASAAFGFTSTNKVFKVDTDGGLTFEIDKSVSISILRVDLN